MNQAHRENLSAFADGELAGDQVRFMLRRVETDAGLRLSWSGYHLTRACLRGELDAVASGDFAERVMGSLEPRTAARTGAERRWLHWSAGGAIAASVAAMALMVARPTAPGDRPSPPVQASATQVPARTLASQPVRSAAEAPRWLTPSSPVALMAQPAAASFLDGRMRGDTLMPATYSRNMAPYMQLRGYPYPAYGNAPTPQVFQRGVDGRWSAPMMPPSGRLPSASGSH